MRQRPRGSPAAPSGCRRDAHRAARDGRHHGHSRGRHRGCDGDPASTSPTCTGSRPMRAATCAPTPRRWRSFVAQSPTGYRSCAQGFNYKGSRVGYSTGDAKYSPTADLGEALETRPRRPPEMGRPVRRRLHQRRRRPEGHAAGAVQRLRARSSPKTLDVRHPPAVPDWRYGKPVRLMRAIRRWSARRHSAGRRRTGV